MKQTQGTHGLLGVARRLLGPDFLYRAGEAIGHLGVVGEERNRRVVLLAGITKELLEPVSIMAIAPSSSGKSNLLSRPLQLFPPAAVIELSSLSKKALAYKKKSFARKIFYLQEYKGGKEAHYLIRQLQTEGRIAHEATTVTGAKRGTQVARQRGRPVVLTSATEERLSPDDATRFLIISLDQSPEQTLAIAKAQINRQRQPLQPSLRGWQLALSLIKPKKGDFQKPPNWLHYVATKLPLDQVRVRRDWGRFLSLGQAIALCRRGLSKSTADITFADYIVAYKILRAAFAGTACELRPQEKELLRALRILLKRSGRAVSAKAISRHLGWKLPRVYKTLDLAAKHGAVGYESGTRERNEKRIVAVHGPSSHFLPKPSEVLRNCDGLPDVIRFVDPFTGKWKCMKRR